MVASLIFQLSSIINFFLSTYLVILLVFYGFFEIASDSFLIISFISIITHGLSANIRNIYLGSVNTININTIIKMRIVVAIALIALAVLIILYTAKNINYIFYLSLILLVTTNWILELVIAKHEKHNFILNYFPIMQVLLILFSTVAIFFENLILLSFFIIIYSLIGFYHFIKTYFKHFSLNLQIQSIYFSFGILSTILKYISNFAWRFFTIMLIGKNQSAILFMAFSLGSLFVTIFDISYGAKWLKKIKYKNLFINFFYIIYVLICGIILIIVKLFSEFDDNQYLLFQSTTIFSVLGAFFLIHSLQKRQKMYENILTIKICYNLDVIVSVFNFCIIPALYYLHASYLQLTYLVSSLFCYILYVLFFYYVFLKKNFF